jgi:hypothetical protein
MSDVLLDMVDELRRTRPPIYQADEWRLWIDAMGQTIAAFPTERQWAVTALVANDLVVAMPGLCLPIAYQMIALVTEGRPQ